MGATPEGVMLNDSINLLNSRGLTGGTENPGLKGAEQWNSGDE